MTTTNSKNKTVATFGAALTSMYAATELQADVVNLNFTPGSIGPGNFVLPVTMTASGFFGSMLVDNNSIFGKNFYGNNISYLGIVSLSQTISPGTFFGSGVTNSYSASGTQFIGFRSVDGDVGWFQVDLGAPAGGTIVIVGGALGNAGEPVHVGIPEPSTTVGLALLAMGAAGVRRRKKDCQSQQAAQAE